MCSYPLCSFLTSHSLLRSLFIRLRVHPFIEIYLVNITNDFHAVKSNGLFSVVNFLNLSFDGWITPSFLKHSLLPSGTHPYIYRYFKYLRRVSEKRFWHMTVPHFFSYFTGPFSDWFADSSSSQCLNFGVQGQILGQLFILTIFTLWVLLSSFMALNMTYILMNLKYLALIPNSTQPYILNFRLISLTSYLIFPIVFLWGNLNLTCPIVTEDAHLISLPRGSFLPRSEVNPENYKILLLWSCL